VNARAVDDAAAVLRDLRFEAWEDLALGAIAFAASLVATQRAQPLALPLFMGGLACLALGVRALWRQWDLVDRLCDDPAAYVIPEVVGRAERETTMGRRRAYAAQLRYWVRDPGAELEARVAAVAGDLLELSAELEDPGLSLDPASGVVCMRLLSDIQVSPLLNLDVPADELRSRIFQIRSGLRRAPDSQPVMPTSDHVPSARLQP
jgi:hypothetical protein